MKDTSDHNYFQFFINSFFQLNDIHVLHFFRPPQKIYRIFPYEKICIRFQRIFCFDLTLL